MDAPFLLTIEVFLLTVIEFVFLLTVIQLVFLLTVGEPQAKKTKPNLRTVGTISKKKQADFQP